MRKSPYGIYGQLEGRANIIGKPKLFATTYDERSIENMPTVEEAQKNLVGGNGINNSGAQNQMRVFNVPKFSL